MEDMNWQHRTMIIPIALAESARQACMALTGPASEGLFLTMLSPNGLEPATHAISSGYIDSEFADVLPEIVYTYDSVGKETKTVKPANVEDIQTKFKEKNVTMTQAAITGLLDGIYVSAEEPYAAMARLGLQIVGTGEQVVPENGPWQLQADFK